MGSFTSFGQVIPVTGPNLGFPGTISRQGERVVPSRKFSPLTATNNLNFGDPTLLLEDASGGAWTSVYDAVTKAIANIGLVASQFAGIAVREVQTQLAYPYGAGIVPGALQVGYYAPGQMADCLERGSATVLISVANSPVSGAPLYTRVVANTAVSAGSIGDWEVGTPAATDLFTLAVGAGGAAEGQAVIPAASTTNIQVGQVVSGIPGIPAGAYVASFAANTSITLNKNLTSALVAGNLMTISNLVLLPNAVARTGYVDVNSMLEVTLKIRNAA